MESTFRARLLESSRSTLGMLRAAKNLVAWGQVNPEVLENLLRKRGEREGNKEFDDEFPRGGFKRSTRRAATDGGELGYRGEDINRLVKRMI